MSPLIMPLGPIQPVNSSPGYFCWRDAARRARHSTIRFSPPLTTKRLIAWSLRTHTISLDGVSEVLACWDRCSTYAVHARMSG